MVKKVRQTPAKENFHWRRLGRTILLYGLIVAAILAPAAYEIYSTGTLPEILTRPAEKSSIAHPEPHGLVVQSLLLTSALFGSLVFMAYLLLMTPAAVIQRTRQRFGNQFLEN